MSKESSYPGTKEVKWGPEDTAFVNNTLKKKNTPVPFDYEKLRQKHESLGY